METESYNVWQILAGVGLFLFGMNLMEHAIRHLAGRSFKVFLRKQTANPYKAVAAGLLITALLQSSSIVNLLTLAFVAARVVTMRNALAVILGANVGSTIYNWIVVFAGFKFEIESFSFPLMAAGAVGLIFFRNNKRMMHWTRLVIGFALLFFGLSNIKDGVDLLVADINFTPYTQYGTWLFVIVGFVITSIVQSSSTTVVIALAALHGGALDLPSAAGLVIGSELGTSIKVVLGAIGNSPDKKKVALGNFLFNLSGAIITFIFLTPLLHLITETIGIKDPLISLVFFQSTINVGTLIMCFPFLSPFARWLERQFGSDSANLNIHLNKILLNEPEEGVTAIRKETRRLLVNIVDLNREAFEIERTGKGDAIHPDDLIIRPKGQTYSGHYEIVKQLNGEIIDFCIELKHKDQEGTEQEQLAGLLSVLRHTMSAAKSIKDIRHNIKDYRDSENDLLHSFFKRFQENEEPFYVAISELLKNDWSPDAATSLQQSVSENNTRFHMHLAKLFHMNEKEGLDDLEMATLINVFTAINDSHEYLTRAISELYSNGETIRE